MPFYDVLFTYHDVFEVHPCVNMYWCSIFSPNNIFHMVWINHVHHSFISLGCFYSLAIMDNVALNIHVWVFVGTNVFHSFGYIPRSGTGGSYAKSTFNLLRKHQSVFHSGFTISHSHQQCLRAQIFLHPCQYLLLSDFFFILSDFLNMTILLVMKWYLMIFLICISPMIEKCCLAYGYLLYIA